MSKLILKQVTMIESYDWDDFVSEIYKKPYCFQQQDGCKDRGTFDITIPEDYHEYFPDNIPYKINGEEMGVSFKSWLGTSKNKYKNSIFWERNFYPDVQAIANDLYEKGHLSAGEYTINIDW